MSVFEEFYEGIMGPAEVAAEDGHTEVAWDLVRAVWQFTADYRKELPEDAEARARTIFERANMLATGGDEEVFLLNVEGALARLRGMLPVAV